MEGSKTVTPPKAEASASASSSRTPPPPRRRGKSRRGLAAFKYRNYRYYFAGQFTTVIGMWMQSVALSWLVVANLGGSAFDLGVVNALNFIPTLFFGLYAGSIADRFNKRNLINICQFINFALAGTQAFLIVTDRASINQVFLFALLLGLSNAFNTPARQALTSELVDKKDLMNAVALNSALFNAGRVIGPSLAGVLVAAFGPALCFAINAASYLIGIGLFRGIHLRSAAERARAGAGMGGVREGLAYVRRTDRILIPTILVGVLSVCAMNFNVWLPLIANEEFNIGAAGYGLFMGALGVGSLVGALGLAFFSDRPRLKAMFALALALGVVEVVLAVASSIPTSVWVVLPLLALIGFTMSTATATANTVVQTTSPDAMRGRIMAVYMTVFTGAGPVGSLLTGAAAERFGTPVAIGLGGALSAVLVGGLWLFARTRNLSPRATFLDFEVADSQPEGASAGRTRRATSGDAVRVSAVPRLRDAPAFAPDEANED